MSYANVTRSIELLAIGGRISFETVSLDTSHVLQEFVVLVLMVIALERKKVKSKQHV